jgi:glutamyl/glutaminyl-tRNA synthetase
MEKKESVHRNTPPASNLEIFEKLLKGDRDFTNYCLRAKIDMSSVNGTMRDPVLYR